MLGSLDPLFGALPGMVRTSMDAGSLAYELVRFRLVGGAPLLWVLDDLLPPFDWTVAYSGIIY